MPLRSSLILPHMTKTFSRFSSAELGVKVSARNSTRFTADRLPAGADLTVMLLHASTMPAIMRPPAPAKTQVRSVINP